MRAKPYLELLEEWTQKISSREQGGSQRILELHSHPSQKYIPIRIGPLVLLVLTLLTLLALLALLGKFSQENSGGNECRR
jgi:hypothetical protein